MGLEKYSTVWKIWKEAQIWLNFFGKWLKDAKILKFAIQIRKMVSKSQIWWKFSLKFSENYQKSKKIT